MAFEIVWTAKARVTFLRTLQYLDEEWSRNSAIKFHNMVTHALKNLRKNPLMGRRHENLPQETRSILITRHTRLYYRVIGSEILLVKFFNTRQHPDRALE